MVKTVPSSIVTMIHWQSGTPCACSMKNLYAPRVFVHSPTRFTGAVVQRPRQPSARPLTPPLAREQDHPRAQDQSWAVSGGRPRAPGLFGGSAFPPRPAARLHHAGREERVMTANRTSYVYVGLAGETAPNRVVKSGLYRMAV